MLHRPVVISGIAALISAALAHIAFSAGATYIASNYKTRIFDVREFPDESEFPQLVGGYLQSQSPSNKTVVAGSSFSFGYPFAAELAFPSYMRFGTINASIIGADVQRIGQIILCEMRNRDLRAAQLVIEFPLINETGVLKDPERKRPIDTACGSATSLALWRHALTKPRALHWASLLRDRYSKAVERRAVSIAPLPDSYFATGDEFESIKRDLRQRMEIIYALGSQVADEAYLFVTPVYIPGVAKAGRDAESIGYQFEFAEAACIEIAGENCIRTRGMLDDPSHYSNITHLGADGAAYLARLVEQRLNR